MGKLPTYVYAALFFLLVAANVSFYRALSVPDTLHISVLGAGEGNAVFMRTPSGETLLADAGPDAGILRALGGVLPPWRREIDSILLTSSAADAAGGAPEVLNRYRVGALVRAGAQGSGSMEAALAAAASAEEGLQQTSVPYGTLLSLEGGIFITIVAPGTLSISYGETSLTVSSSTPKGVYVSNGTTLVLPK